MQTIKNAICLVFIYLFCFIMFISVSSAQEDKSLEKYYIGNALYNKGLYSLAINNYTTIYRAVSE